METQQAMGFRAAIHIAVVQNGIDRQLRARNLPPLSRVLARQVMRSEYSLVNRDH
jgi:hypothetical protein